MAIYPIFFYTCFVSSERDYRKIYYIQGGTLCWKQVQSSYRGGLEASQFSVIPRSFRANLPQSNLPKRMPCRGGLGASQFLVIPRSFRANPLRSNSPRRMSNVRREGHH